MHVGVRGTGYVGLIALAAWLTALIGPIIALVRTARGLRALITDLLSGALSGLSGSFVDSFALRAGGFSGAMSLWNMTRELFSAASGGFFRFMLGMLLVIAVVIPMFFLSVALQRNLRASRKILIANLCLCAYGNWLCYTVIKRMADAIGALLPPYDKVAQNALIAMAVSAALWGLGFVYYSSLAARSERTEGLESQGGAS